MDRSMMESVPYQVLEGMLIGAYATGATKIFIYCRAEYPMAIANLNIAIEQIKANKLNIIDGREIDIYIKEGAVPLSAVKKLRLSLLWKVSAVCPVSVRRSRRTAVTWDIRP